MYFEWARNLFSSTQQMHSNHYDDSQTNFPNEPIESTANYATLHRIYKCKWFGYKWRDPTHSGVWDLEIKCHDSARSSLTSPSFRGRTTSLKSSIIRYRPNLFTLFSAMIGQFGDRTILWLTLIWISSSLSISALANFTCSSRRRSYSCTKSLNNSLFSLLILFFSSFALVSSSDRAAGFVSYLGFIGFILSTFQASESSRKWQMRRAHTKKMKIEKWKYGKWVRMLYHAFWMRWTSIRHKHTEKLWTII